MHTQWYQASLLLNGWSDLAVEDDGCAPETPSRNHQYQTMATYTNMPATRTLLLCGCKEGRATRRTMVLDSAMRQFVGPVIL